MMGNKINIDDFFKSKLHNRNAEFDASDWLAMESLLDQNDRKRRRIFPFFWLVIGVAISAFLGFVLFNGNENVPKKPKVASGFAVESTESKSNHPAQNVDLKQNSQAFTNPINKGEEQKVNTKKETNDPTTLKQSIQQSSIKDENAKNDQIDASSSIVETVQRMDQLASEQTENIVEVQTQNENRIIFLEQMPIYSPYINSQKENLEIMPISVPSMMEKYVEPHLSLGIGGGVLGSTSGFAGFEAGIVADYHFDRTWAIQTGFLFSQRNLGSIYSKIREDISYNFGQVSTIYGMNAQTLAYGSLPILAYFKNEKNHFGGGITVDFLMGVKGEIQEVTLMESIERSKIKDVKSIIQTGWIDMTAFQKTNARLQVNYRREILPSIFIGSNLSYQMSPVLATSPQELNAQKTNKLFIGLNMQLFLK
ncbi:MAG TPA: hypothetical protein PLY70_13165 [Saprospiraceae bacterium]|nr:hypothetical protein [Saprospiraceae bacterium]HPN68467.1 hypothetical protein [Saprospiraceae bacterium]